MKEMHDGIYGHGGNGPPSVGSGRQSYTHQGNFSSPYLSILTLDFEWIFDMFQLQDTMGFR